MEYNIEELREKRRNELVNSIGMLHETINDMEKRGVNKGRIDEVLSLSWEKKKELDFICGLSDKEFMVYLNLPFDKITQIVPFNCWDAEKNFDIYKKVFNSAVASLEKEEDGEKYDVERIFAIDEPLRKNNFLVYLPSYYNISVKDIVSFDYNRQENTILLTVRETCGKKQIQKILEMLNDENVNNEYEEIQVQHLRPDYSLEYTHYFKDIKLLDFHEEPLTYQVKHDADVCRYFQIIFRYDKDIIK